MNLFLFLGVLEHCNATALWAQAEESGVWPARSALRGELLQPNMEMFPAETANLWDAGLPAFEPSWPRGDITAQAGTYTNPRGRRRSATGRCRRRRRRTRPTRVNMGAAVKVPERSPKRTMGARNDNATARMGHDAEKGLFR